MDRLSITTHLIAVLTAFSAFTMPIALEVLNRVRSRYGSSYYMDAIEQIIGFKIKLLFRELIGTLIVLMGFSYYVSIIDPSVFTNKDVYFFELLFLLITSALLIKELKFITTVFLATKSDSLVTEHLLLNLTKPHLNAEDSSSDVELLVQIACFNVEHSTTTSSDSTEKRLFTLIEQSSKSNDDSIKLEILKKLVSGLAATLTSARKTNNRDKYVSIQREYGRLLILFYDKKIIIEDFNDEFLGNLYKESIKEIGSGQYWLLRVDFLIGLGIWDITRPETIKFIDRHVRNLMYFLVTKKPELLSDLIDNYRNLVAYESDLTGELHRLPFLLGSYNNKHHDKLFPFINDSVEIKDSPVDLINRFKTILDLYIQDEIKISESEIRNNEIKETAYEYEKLITQELIKEVGIKTARTTAQHILRALANHRQWRCILDCHEIFNPATSQVSRCGINLLPASLNDIIDQLGTPFGYSTINTEELSQAYITAMPILIMYALYCWRAQNLNKNLNNGITDITTSLNITKKTIVRIKNTLIELKKAQYYAKSPIYSKLFCEHFGIEHEEKEFHSSIAVIIRKIQFYLNNQLLLLKKNQPLSDNIKNNLINKVVRKDYNLLKKYPLFSHVSLSSDKKQPNKVDEKLYNREVFLDNTGVTRIFHESEFNLVDKSHRDLSIRIIENVGTPIESLNLKQLNNNQLLVITHKDWNNYVESKDLDRVAARTGINLYLIKSNEPLNSFYVYNKDARVPLITLYSPNNDVKSTELGDHLRNAFDFEFIDNNEEQVSVKVSSHIYFY